MNTISKIRKFLRPRTRLRSLRHFAINLLFHPELLTKFAARTKFKSSKYIVYISGQPNTNGSIYRVDRYLEAAKSAGFIASSVGFDKLFNSLINICRADIIIIWRVYWCLEIEMVFNIAKASGAKVVFDIDDLIFDPSLANIETVDGIRTLFSSEDEAYTLFESMQRTYKSASYYSAPTEFLAKQMSKSVSNYFVLPNGFDAGIFKTARDAVKQRENTEQDGLLRIGYAAGSSTHQRDFAQVAPAISQILSENPNCRLVLFKHLSRDLLDTTEFSILNDVCSQIEWRNSVPLSDLPRELARFDINLAPLEADNVFCNAKSELKYFEAALVNVPTIASPTEPYRLAIKHAVTGFLANTPDEWYEILNQLINNSEQREQIGRAAYEDVIWKYGPERRVELIKSMVEKLS